MEAPQRRPQRDMQDRAFFRNVDLIAAKHGVDPRTQPGFLGQLEQELHGFIRDAVLGVVQKDTRGLSRQSLSTLGIIREKTAQVRFVNFLIVRFELLPSLAVRYSFDRLILFRTWCHNRTLLYFAIAFLSAALLESITASSSFQESTNDLAPSC